MKIMFCGGRLLFLLLAENQKRSISLFDSANTQLGILRFKDLLFANRAFCSISTDTDSDKKAFTVSYLINSCGLSPDSAKSVSHYLRLRNTKNPDSILSLLRDHGLTYHQISKVVRTNPQLLTLDAAKTVLPKLQFLRSVGFLSDDLSALMWMKPWVMSKSLNQYLIPFYHILKSVPLSDKQIVATFKRFFARLNLNNFDLNVSTLKEIGMPPSAISMCFTRNPNVICMDAGKFNQAVTEVVEMGFDPVRSKFFVALRAKIGLSMTTWKRKIDAFKKWGISENEIFVAFRKHPQCMLLSEESINNKLNFLLSKMGWQPADVLEKPVVICFSLRERIVPRCSIIRVLLLKGLISDRISLASFIMPSDKQFSEKYVIKHKEQVPELLDVFEGTYNVEDLGFGSDETRAAS